MRPRLRSQRSFLAAVAGNRKKGFPDDRSVAIQVPIGGADVYADLEGNFCITDEGFPGSFMVDTQGILTVLAGTDVHRYSGDGGPAIEAQLSEPTTVAVGPDGDAGTVGL